MLQNKRKLAYKQQLNMTISKRKRNKQTKTKMNERQIWTAHTTGPIKGMHQL